MRMIIQKLQGLLYPSRTLPTIASICDDSVLCNGSTNNDEVHMTTPELITKHGYLAETHHVWTKDGYRLELHRIIGKAQDDVPPSETCNNAAEDETEPVKVDIKLECTANAESSFLIKDVATKKSPVLINHGLLSSSADWVLLGPKKALAYNICDEGYDVWLMNSRGNTYSQCHKQWSTKDKEFWNYSMQETGCYDLPAVIDYILENTESEDLFYIGYSQATTGFFVMISEKPEYNKKIKKMIGLAPIAFLTNQGSPLLKVVTPFNYLMELISAYCNIHQWFPRNKLQAQALGTILRNVPDSIIRTFCNCWFNLVAGFGSNQLEKSMLPIIFGHFPSGVSFQQIRHYAQIMLTDSFRKFDYGEATNMQLYGSSQPPEYKFENARIPVYIFYSDNDFLTQPADIKRLVDSLPNVQLVHKIEYSKFNHIDYLWGKDAKTLLYNHVIRILNES